MSYNLFNPFVSLLSFTSLILMAKPPPLAAFKLTLLLLVKMPFVIVYACGFLSQLASLASAYIVAIYFFPGSKKSNANLVVCPFSSAVQPTYQSPVPLARRAMVM